MFLSPGGQNKHIDEVHDTKVRAIENQNYQTKQNEKLQDHGEHQSYQIKRDEKVQEHADYQQYQIKRNEKVEDHGDYQNYQIKQNGKVQDHGENQVPKLQLKRSSDGKLKVTFNKNIISHPIVS